MSRPPSWTLGCGTHPLTLQPKTAGWEWAAACQRFWLRPPPTGLGSPASTMRPRRWPRGQAAATAIEFVVTQEERITEPHRCRRPVGAASSSCRHCAPPFPAPGFRRAGQDPRPDRRRKPQHGRHAGQPSAGPRDLRCGLVRVRPDAALQAGVASWPARRGRPLVSINPPMPAMRGHRRCDDAGRSGVHLRLRAYRRQGYQRGDESGPLGPHPPRSPSSNPGPPSRRPATNARRRDGSGQHPRVGETSPDDAGTDVHTAPAA
ncbi:hypothetical protein JMUB5695_00709 [Mycobacterium heckeshornense]|nr:hypothetical protein JMUB5695_00709 [Mycobacterium heckeshornense]